MTITDAELSLHEGIVAACSAPAFSVDPQYLLALIREVRELRAKVGQSLEAPGEIKG